ncbi:hypothetical protein GCT13_41170 [Paraburkholderia sp. CNPSo 3157]|uniref:DUF4431 domain-containing protein n=1 Tax=Paraburkholderia franconis TaxID=2654983 RepID=A0A7X1TL16_9BURK|nr:hypothetical protein [Paraburkholderia franconis]MPW23023.1 hypothetical protein [Paraburkholderia franconis]
MRNRLLCVMLLMWSIATWAGPVCFPVGTALTLRGTTAQEIAETGGGAQQTISVLLMEPPLCVIDPRFGQDAQRRIMITRVQLVGPPPPAPMQLTVTGTLMRRNTPQYYVVPTAVWATPPKKPPPQ